MLEAGCPLETIAPDAACAGVEYRVAPVGPRGRIRLRIIRPRQAARRLPVVMYFHGPGWTPGEEATHDQLVRAIADGANTAVVFLDYDHSPDVSSSLAIEEAFAATAWVASNGRALGIDAGNLAVAGDSAGCCISAAVAMLAKERFGPKIRAQVLFFPVTDAGSDAAPNSTAPGAGCALQASVDRLRGLPPALVITGTLDALREQAEGYVDRLVAAGVTVTFSRYLGVLHDFVEVDEAADQPAARAAAAQASALLRRAFAA